MIPINLRVEMKSGSKFEILIYVIIFNQLHPYLTVNYSFNNDSNYCFMGVNESSSNIFKLES